MYISGVPPGLYVRQVGLGLFIIAGLSAALEPVFEGWPVGIVVALEHLAIGHYGALERISRTQLLLSPALGLSRFGIAQVGPFQVGPSQVGLTQVGLVQVGTGQVGPAQD